ncbi:putative polyketide synthase [Daldinia bambusicola]|nr:putative polyketide synthase [Daldinia bambusicola]
MHLNGNSETDHQENGRLGGSLREDDPICVVGMACRLPGDVRSPSELWQFLMERKTGQGRVPPERYNIDGFYSSKGEKHGVMNVDGGYFIREDVRLFDNEFFGINNYDATYETQMDPQQRKLLEIVFECFENAGTSLSKMSDSNTGVYVGNFTQDTLQMQMRDPDELRRYHATGNGLTMLANRISHVFNLHGPSLTLDTACSSSIYCLHLAVTALKAGECDGAIVAASNLILTPGPHIAAMKAGMLSPTSTCHTFDISADGYARAEGVNAVYVKRLSSAIKNNDTIYGIIRGTAVNSNGRTPGMIYPSAEFQEVVVRKTYKDANLDFSETDYIECHGTGTELGDHVELNALANCFSSRENPIMIGGTKPSFGHGEAASSLTSLIKVLLAFQHGLIPPTRGVETLNPKLELDRHNMEVVTEPRPWPRKTQRASLSSFGYGGANAHVILESFSSYTDTSPPYKNGLHESCQPILLPISASSRKSLEARIGQIQQLAQTCDVPGIESLGYTLAERLSHLRYRTSLLITPNKEETPEEWPMELSEDSRDSEGDPFRFAFVFTGQGAQYSGMGKSLLDSSPIFVNTIRELDQVLRSLPPPYAPDWTLEGMLRGETDDSKINEAVRSQPVCTALQIGLVNLLQAWGVQPSATLGHSSGEIGAAYAAGLLSASQALLAAYFRGYSVAENPTSGAMLACGLGINQAEEVIEKCGLTGQVGIACFNSQESLTLSGPKDCIDQIQSELLSQKTFCRLLKTGGQPYHSSWMKNAGVTYEKLLEPYFQDKSHESPSRATMYSTVYHKGDRPESVDSSIPMAKYWRDNLEKPVRFDSTLKHLIQNERLHLIEIGSHSALKGPINQIRRAAMLDEQVIPYSPTLIRERDAHLSMVKLAGRLFTYGYELDWEAINRVPGRSRILFSNLPPYPWDYSGGLRWFEPRGSIEVRNRSLIRHELLGSQQVAGNGIDWSWRNILRPNEMPWIRDHKIEGLVVFPAAGYLAMAIEAVTRARVASGSPLHERITFDLHNVSINSAMVVPEDNDLGHVPVEVHTLLTARRLSSKTSSAAIYDFTISSWTAGQATVHCLGSIRVSGTPLKAVAAANGFSGPSGYRNWNVAKWYEKFTEEGVSFGPYFKTLTAVRADIDQAQSEILCTAKISSPMLKDSANRYAMHPVTIDACLQATLISATSGDPDSFRAYIPVFISECRIETLPLPDEDEDQQGIIHATSQRTGFSSLRADTTLRDRQGIPLVQMKGVRLTRYTGKVIKDEDFNNPHLQRYPATDVNWKPDIMHLTPDTVPQLEAYIAKSAHNRPSSSDDEYKDIISTILDLAGHKNPRMRVLEIGGSNEQTKNEWLELLADGTAFPRFRSWQTTEPDEEGDLKADSIENARFDVVVHNDDASQKLWKRSPEHLLSLVDEHGIVIARKSDSVVSELTASNFRMLDIQDRIIVGIRRKEPEFFKGRTVLIVTREVSPPLEAFISSLTEDLRQTHKAQEIRTISLAELPAIEISDNAVCISLIEIERPFLADMCQEDLTLLHNLMSAVKNIVWLVGANLVGTPNPDLTLVQGISNSIMVEQPSLRFAVLDVGSIDILSSDARRSCQNIIQVLERHEKIDDRGFVLLKGLLYVSRIEPNATINAVFQSRTKKTHSSMKQLTLSDASPAKLCIEKVGMMDSLYFQQICDPHTSPPRGFVDVEVKVVSLNAKDVYAMSGHVETRTGTSGIEFGGVVTAIGPDEQNFKVGDRVVVLRPNHSSTTERVPAWTCHKLLEGEDMAAMATLPTIYAAALYAIRDCGRLRAGESVLIHSGAGAFGIAAITLAQRAGAVIYTTVSSDKKREFLVNYLGLPASHVFNSRDDSFEKALNTVTGGRGVNVVINSLVGDLMHASWRCLAQFGRFVEVGKRELVDDGRLEMDIFSRNTTFVAFDLSETFFQEGDYYENLLASLIEEVLELYRSKQIQPVPITTFDVSNITQAYRYFSSRDRIGKIVISFENPKSLLTVAPPKYITILDPAKVYLLVGALGGLGRSLVCWMKSRGGKKFVFLQRSGCDKPSAQEFVTWLKQEGVSVTVVKGDVTRLDDVVAAIEACKKLGGPIGGVMQAAMGLHEDLFSAMTSDSWHESVRPKWAGTWNLHKALDGHEEALDFFLMISSMNGTTGLPTESNYSAANAFLDSFAYWRRSQGKTAVSLALGMVAGVGYLHENPKIEELLLRRGTQPLSENDVLLLADIAIGGVSSYSGLGHRQENVAPAHILTGLETANLRKIINQGFEVSNSTLDDHRLAILAASLEIASNPSGSSGNKNSEGDHQIVNTPWMRGLPQEVTDILRLELAGASSLKGVVLGALTKRFSDLLLTPRDQIDPNKPFAQFGLDSMIASEFRSWLWNSLKVDVPFLDLLGSRKSLDTVAGLVEVDLLSRTAGSEG